MALIEKHYVHTIYDNIATRFDVTRRDGNRWEAVKSYINSLEPNSVIIDVGCGNGKYHNVRDDLLFIGLDICVPLLLLANERYENSEFMISDITSLPLREAITEYVISIAVIHHISTFERRLTTIDKIIKLATKSILFSVWAVEAVKPKWVNIGYNDWLVPWDKSGMRFYHVFDKKELDELFKNYNYRVYYEHENWYIYVTI